VRKRRERKEERRERSVLLLDDDDEKGDLTDLSFPESMSFFACLARFTKKAFSPASFDIPPCPR